MKVGFELPSYARWWRGDGVWATCEKAKEIGVDSLFFVDHVIVSPEEYVGMGNGFMDIWTAMTYVAAVTNVQRWAPILTQCVAVIPYRPAIQSAKVIATLDSLSGGRLLIGAGTGYNYEEFDSLSLSYEDRGARTDEYLKAMIALWTDGVASFHGKYVNFNNKTVSVRPAQKPYPGIMVGGRGKRPFRRIAEYCQGYVPGIGERVDRELPPTHPNYGRPRYEPKDLVQDIAEITKLWREYGRQGNPYIAAAPRHVMLTTKHADEGQIITKGINEGNIPYRRLWPVTHVQNLVNEIREWDAAGVEHIGIHLPSIRYGEFDNQAMLLNQMEMFAEHVLPKIPRDKKPIEMDFGGKLYTPLAVG